MTNWEGAGSPLTNNGFLWKPALKGSLTHKEFLRQWKPAAARHNFYS